MALGLSVGNGGGGEDRMPYVKYDARSGRMFRVDRNNVGGAWQTDQVDITGNAQFVVDLANVQVGWISFGDQGPVKMLVPLGTALPPRPEGLDSNGKPAFKQGFSLRLALAKECGGGVREFGSNAACVIEAMNELHDAYGSAAEAKAGKLPIVKMGNATPVKSGQSTNYKPMFAIVGWADRPATLQAPTAQATPIASPPSTGSTIVSPPTTVLPPNNIVPQQAAAMASDFG
jgi:hypothetical protein